MSREKIITAVLAIAAVGIVVALLFGIQGKASVERAKISEPEPEPAPIPPDSGVVAQLPEQPPEVAPEPSDDEVPIYPPDYDPNDPLMPRITPRLREKMNDPTQKGWWNFNEEEKVAQGELQHDTADFGDVVTTLEAGERIKEIRGDDVTDEEQNAMRDAVADFAKVYEEANVSAQTAEGSIINMADTVRSARSEFDAKITDIYGLSEDQLYELFPHRREFEIPAAP